jgi:hypothetical protein
MWFFFIGSILIVVAILGEKLNVSLYKTGRPGVRSEADTSVFGRIAIGVLGAAFLWMGVSDLLR